MSQISVEKTKLDGVFVITPPTRFEDFRGSYIEIYNQQIYENSFSGVISANIPGVSASEAKSYNFDVDNESKTKVLDMSINNTDIYGSYY